MLIVFFQVKHCVHGVKLSLLQRFAISARRLIEGVNCFTAVTELAVV